MLFNSLEFIIFLVSFFVFWPFLRRLRNARWAYITAMSFLFYGWWDWRFLFLLAGSGLLDYSVALGIAKLPRLRWPLLFVSLFGNIGALFVFKYLDFAIYNVKGILELTGVQPQFEPIGLILPVGISFYTFQSMSYTIDVFRRRIAPTKNVLHFFAYLSMFPQMVAGPIVRASDLLPQLLESRPSSESQRWEGLQLIAYGFFKKVVIADTLAVTVNSAFANSYSSNGLYWWIIMTAFAFQIYCDFSGYSDIARGIARWMGYNFLVNFDHPYISKGLSEFWCRWHISLSSWFRDYVYVPLGGSRVSPATTHRNLWATMILSGIWHGASWNFVAWGAIHACFLSVEKITQWPNRLSRIPGGKYLAIGLTFSLVLISWVYFRATDLSTASNIVWRMFDLRSYSINEALALIDAKALLLISLMIGREASILVKLQSIEDLWTSSLRQLQPLMTAILIAISIYFRGPGQAFIYFQF